MKARIVKPSSLRLIAAVDKANGGIWFKMATTKPELVYISSIGEAAVMPGTLEHVLKEHGAEPVYEGAEIGVQF